jgi:hypothetical protein
MPPPQIFFNITSPTGGLPFVNRTFTLAGNISTLFVPARWSLVSKSVTVQFGPGVPAVAASFSGATMNWQCTGTVSPSTPWGSMVQLTIHVSATYRFLLTPFEPDFATISNTNTFMVRLFPAITPTVSLGAFPSPIVGAQMPLNFAFTGSATSPQAPIQLVQYKVEGGQFANAVNVSGNWSQFRITLPLPPTDPANLHTLTVRATDIFGTVGEVSQPVSVQAQPPIVAPPGGKTTLSGAPTTSSITSWTRLEPQCTDADMGTSSSARIFDPLWMLTRQWQMGEFQAEDAGTPVQARVRATTATLTRRFSGELPKPTGAGPATVAAATYDPARTPLEVLVERRRMRAADANDPRMLTFAVESGLHLLRMLELAGLSKSYRTPFVTKFALQPLSAAASELVDDATARYMQSMVGRAPDGRQVAALLRTSGAAQLVADSVLNIATADGPKVQQAGTSWLAWYDTMYSEPSGPADDAWNPPRLEYSLAVGARLSTNALDDMTFSATEIDGPIDWSSFDVTTQASLTTAADQSFTSVVEAIIPAPVTFPGAPAPRFWEMEDARIAYGLVPVGPTDLAHLMMIEYASTFGNDWFIVPLTLPVGSVTRVDSLVVTDTFGVRNLIRPIGDPALPAPFFSMWQMALKSTSSFSTAAPRPVVNRFFLPPTLTRTIDSPALEDVLFMRDEMANLAWAIERAIESPIEQPAQRYESPDAAPISDDLLSGALPRYLLSSRVPPNWIPLLPVQVPNPLQAPNTPGQILSRLKRGAVLQPDGSRTVHSAKGEVLLSIGNGLFYDEEVPREGVRITRRRRLARWTDGSTWLWTSFKNEVGQGEGTSQLKFDQIIEPRGSTPAE